MAGPTAFQADAFQNDAFQIEVSVEEITGSPSYEQRFFTDAESGNRRFATAAYADATLDDGGPVPGPRRFSNGASGKRRSATGSDAKPTRSDGWRRQPPG